MIAKDILKPHAIYWPCMLAALATAHGKPREAYLYQHLNVHGYWTIEGQKMSKSLGNVFPAVAPAEKYGVDAYRYFVLREMVFGLDADFSEGAMVGRLNADLANDLGNLVARATTLIASYAAGAGAPGPGTADEESVVRAAAEARRGLDEAMGEFAFQRGLAAIWELIGALNRYVDATQPWALAKKPAERPRLDRVLVTLADAVGYLGIVLDPFVPEAAAKIRTAIGGTTPPRLADAVLGRLERLPAVQKLSGLFPRVGDSKSDKEARKAVAAMDTPAGVDEHQRITIDEFSRIQLRVAEVLAAEAVPKSKKLLKLTVSLGSEQRTIVAGIAQHYAPADLIGKKVVVVANLEPATLMSVQSQGMVLAGSTEGDGALAVLTLDRDLPPGARVR
jgi:methionyl-tRNA synthetase